jgi:hypothetical protein|tara:strand:- start:184 stop:399 length:216 start_codon:yes stop_codon:yes gene_type:complete
MLQINPKKFKAIKNKTIPNPLRPKFRSKDQANIYFLSKRKIQGEKKDQFKQKFRLLALMSILLIGGYLLSN